MEIVGAARRLKTDSPSPLRPLSLTSWLRHPTIDCSRPAPLRTVAPFDSILKLNIDISKVYAHISL